MIFYRILAFAIAFTILLVTVGYLSKNKESKKQSSLDELEEASEKVKSVKKEIKGEIDQTQEQISKIKNNLEND